MAGFDRTKLSFEDRRVLPLECQQPAQIRVDVGELDHVRVHVGGLRCQDGPHFVVRNIRGLGIRIPGEVLRQRETRLDLRDEQLRLLLAVAGTVEGEDGAEHGENEDESAHVHEHTQAGSGPALVG